MTKIPFTKMVGTGNDFIVVESRRAPKGVAWPSAARAWCDRHNGIGADGILLLEPAPKADARMRVFNADGSEAEMCGNGARCVALYLSNGHGRGPVRLATGAGVIEAAVQGGRVAMRMTEPTDITLGVRVAAGGKTVRGVSINTGVPHFVVAVPSVAAVDVAGLGRALRRHRAFAPKGTNVNFVQADRSRANRLLVRTYERGVEAETLACGTGMVASAAAHALVRGRSGPWTLAIRPASGDTLTVSFRIEAGAVRDVVLAGPAKRVFDGAADWPARRN